jgi:hypothetical protein
MRGFLAGLGRRWPTWLAIAMAAALADSSSVSALAEALVFLALGYLAAAALRRPNATWVILVVGIGLFAALRLQDWIEPVVVLIVIASGIAVWGAARGRYGWRSALTVETAGMVGFTAIALTALSMDRDAGRYVVAAAWFGHAAYGVARSEHDADPHTHARERRRRHGHRRFRSSTHIPTMSAGSGSSRTHFPGTPIYASQSARRWIETDPRGFFQVTRDAVGDDPAVEPDAVRRRRRVQRGHAGADREQLVRMAAGSGATQAPSSSCGPDTGPSTSTVCRFLPRGGRRR